MKVDKEKKRRVERAIDDALRREWPFCQEDRERDPHWATKIVMKVASIALRAESEGGKPNDE